MQLQERIERWLNAAERARRLARSASVRAANVPDPQVAARYERVSSIYLGSAACFEATARSDFEAQERRIQRAAARARAPLSARQAEHN
jgi:nucleotide-binding universal stress UspA family protein